MADLAVATLQTLRWQLFINSCCIADFGCDGQIGFVDYTVLADHWLKQGCTHPDWCSCTDLTRMAL